jgi:hypothetical protein
VRCDDAASAWSSRLRSEGEAAGALELLVDRVELQQDGIQLSIKLPTESFENLAGRGRLTSNSPG